MDISPKVARRATQRREKHREGQERPRRPWGWITAAGVLVLSAVWNTGPSWLPILRDYFSDPYAARVVSYWAQRGTFRLLRCSRGKLADSEVNTLLRVQITNTSASPRRVDGYHLEVETPDGWKRFGRAALLTDAVTFLEFAAPGSEPAQFLVDKSLDGMLQAETIGPGQSVEGWAFLNYHHEQPPRPAINALTRYRLSIRDARGEEVVEVKAPDHDPVGPLDFFRQLSESPDCPWVPLDMSYVGMVNGSALIQVSNAGSSAYVIHPLGNIRRHGHPGDGAWGGVWVGDGQTARVVQQGETLVIGLSDRGSGLVLINAADPEGCNSEVQLFVSDAKGNQHEISTRVAPCLLSNAGRSFSVELGQVDLTPGHPHPVR